VKAEIGHHPPDFAFQHWDVMQHSLLSDREEFVIGNAAPEKKRQARR
jgi:hypothetical protein